MLEVVRSYDTNEIIEPQRKKHRELGLMKISKRKEYFSRFMESNNENDS